MHWKVKAFILRTVSRLPKALADTLYYNLQYHLGGLKDVNVREHFTRVSEIAQYLVRQNRHISGSTFMEIGTGRRLNVPLGLWLCGAAKIYTVDANRYVKEHLVLESLEYIRENANALRTLLGTSADSELFDKRVQHLLQCEPKLSRIFELTNIEYIAPGDAAAIPFVDSSIDCQVSVSVFEHIEPAVLKNILSEAKRVLGPAGLSIHIIDTSDHFAHSDESISRVNFLQYDEAQWQTIGGNRFAYHNRLRTRDFLDIFQDTGFYIAEQVRYVDPGSVTALQNGLPVDTQFAGSDHYELAAGRIDIVGVVGCVA
jgi:SAM-dependent methyltransferase